MPCDRAMPPPDSPIPQPLRDRLDAAREYLEVTCRWFERGSKECWGRDFGFWEVCAGPEGWTRRPKVENARYGQPTTEKNEGPCIAQSWELPGAITMALDYAERVWPGG
jgi:hypothetical protein